MIRTPTLVVSWLTPPLLALGRARKPSAAEWLAIFWRWFKLVQADSSDLGFAEAVVQVMESKARHGLDLKMLAVFVATLDAKYALKPS